MNQNGQSNDMNGMMPNQQQMQYPYNFQYQMFRQPQLFQQYYYQMNSQFQQQQFMQQQQQIKPQIQQQTNKISTPDQQIMPQIQQMQPQMQQMQQQQYMPQQNQMQRQYPQMQMHNQMHNQIQNPMQNQMQSNQNYQNRQQMMSQNALTMQQIAAFQQYQQRMNQMMNSQKMTTPPQPNIAPIPQIKSPLATPQIKQPTIPKQVASPLPPQKQPKKQKQKKEKKKKKGKNMDDSDSDAAFNTDGGIDEIPEEFIIKRTSGRKTSQISYAEDDEDFIEEEDIKENNEDPHKLDHIYFQRETANGVELLVRFADSQQALCEWVLESTVASMAKAQSHYTKFKAAPVNISVLNTRDDSQPPYPVAHRRENPGAPYQLLFRFTYEANVLFYWDFISQEVLTKYTQGLICVPLVQVSIPPNLPPPLSYVKTPDNTLRPYQVDGIKWLINCWAQKHGSILADEMGLGKTIQILGFLSYLASIKWYGPFLITVRTNCFKQWCDEIEKWTNLKYVAYNGGPASRRMMRDFQMPYLDGEGNPSSKQINFNILLVSYDVLLKDAEFLQYLWQVIVVDEGHRIKNSQGKKNNALASLPYKHRIILTGTPIQNSLSELWALLKFVSPNSFKDDPSFLETDIEQLPEERIREMQEMIKPHLMRRSLGEVERSIAPKEEKVALVRLSEIQEELMRLTKLHSIWRLKGIKVNEETVDTAHEANDMHKICLHPFLIDGAEEFYTQKFRNMSRLELLLSVSAKFAWLDRILTKLKEEGHRVLIFSQFIKLLRLLKEYCTIKGYSHELLTGQMGDVEKNAAVSRFADKDTSSFVFLISTRAGSEGLNLTIADTAIIFDPDWNPQNDLQAQARVHRIGQTQKVDIIRLITYKTYEHEMFVRAQRKLELWRTILEGTSSVDNSEFLPPLQKPPIVEFGVQSNCTFAEELEKVSTVVNNFSPSNLKQLQAPLLIKEEEEYKTSDADFLNQFPVEELDERRTKRSRSMNFAVNASEALEYFNRMKYTEYGHWVSLNDRPPEDVVKFCLAAIVISLRMMGPNSISMFPLLLYYLEEDILDFSLDLVCCGSKHQVFNAFPPEHELSSECETCKYIKDELNDHGYETLMSIEYRLVISSWLNFHSKSDILQTEPGQKKVDESLLKKLFEGESFDVYDTQIEFAIKKMRSDLIISGFNKCLQFSWWTGTEFTALCGTLRNFAFSPETAFEFHSHTGLLSKTTTSIACFAVQLMRLLKNHHGKQSITIPSTISHAEDAPEAVYSNKPSWTWCSISATDAIELNDHVELCSNIRDYVYKEGVNESSLSDYEWSIDHTRLFMEKLLVSGFDNMELILQDERLPFVHVMNNNPDSVPDYVKNQALLNRFLITNTVYERNNGELVFNMPLVSKLKLRCGKEVKKNETKPKKLRRKKFSEDDDEDQDSLDDFLD